MSDPPEPAPRSLGRRAARAWAAITGTDDTAPPPVTPSVTGASPPFDVAEYGAIDDGLMARFQLEWRYNDNTLTILTFSGPVTVANSGPGGVAVVTFLGPGAPGGLGIAPTPERWAHRPIAISLPDGGYFVATVANSYWDPDNSSTFTAVCDGPAPVSLLGTSMQSLTCPCFRPVDVGKWIEIENATPAGGTNGATSGYLAMRTWPYSSTISEYIDPRTVTVNDAFHGSPPDHPRALVVWGTCNRDAFIKAGLAAIAAGQKQLLCTGFAKPFGTASTNGSTGLFFVPNIFRNNGTASDRAEYDFSEVIAFLKLIGRNNAQTWFASRLAPQPGGTNSGFQPLRFRLQAIPDDAPQPPPPALEIDGAHFPTASTIPPDVPLIIAICGDSWGVNDNSGTALNSLVHHLRIAFRRANPHRAAPIFVNRAIGGTRYRNLIATTNMAANASLPWVTDGDHPWSYWIKHLFNLPGYGAGPVTPHIVIDIITGANEAPGLCEPDIAAWFNIVAGWKANGTSLPPDRVMITGSTKFIVNPSQEIVSSAYHHSSGILRSFARTAPACGFGPVGLLDFGAYIDRITNGWDTESMLPGPALQLAEGTASATAPYSLQYQTEGDFYVALKLISPTGGPGVKWPIRIQIGPKPDNCIWVAPDRSGNLNVMPVAWGDTIATPVEIARGSRGLATSGQTCGAYPGFVASSPPLFEISPQGGAPFSRDLKEQCFCGVGAAAISGQDFITKLIGYTVPQIMFCTDGNNLNVANPTIKEFYAGGWMFTQNMCTGTADVVIPGAGTADHPMFGPNCLVTRIEPDGYHSRTQVMLRDAAGSTIAPTSPVAMFVGRCMPCGYEMAIPGGTDTGADPVLTVKREGTHTTVGYVLGSVTGGTRGSPQQYTQNYHQMIWEGDAPVTGGPFVPQVLALGGAQPMQAVYVWIGERQVFQTQLTSLHAWALTDPVVDLPHGGDGVHPSLPLLSLAFQRVIQAQRWAVPFVPRVI